MIYLTLGQPGILVKVFVGVVHQAEYRVTVFRLYAFAVVVFQNLQVIFLLDDVGDSVVTLEALCREPPS